MIEVSHHFHYSFDVSVAPAVNDFLERPHASLSREYVKSRVRQ